ncbi:MAG: HK97 family phage prohead protease [Planctomycetota bacterium]|jgi:HK97 family phage prohead protease
MKNRRFLLPGRCSRSLTVERRNDGDDESPIITGYGAVFFNEDDPGSQYWLWDDTVERIDRNAFDRPIAEDDVRSFFNHDANLILGRNKAETLTLATDDVGLIYNATPPDARLDVVQAVGRGDVDGSSFMFVPTKTTWTEEKRTDEESGREWTLYIRLIEELRLYEVGPVVFPAYSSTTSELRSALADDPAAKRYATWLDAHVRAARDEFDAWQLNSPGAREARAAKMEARAADLGL